MSSSTSFAPSALAPSGRFAHAADPPPPSVRPAPPPEARPRRFRGPSGTLSDDLLDDGASSHTTNVARGLERWSRQYRMAGTWVSARKLAKELGIGVSTVRKALAWLLERGWLARSEDDFQLRSIRVHWCLWLLPDDWSGCDVAFPGGVVYRIADRPPSPSGRARIRPPGCDRATPERDRVGGGARDLAPDSSNEFRRQKDVNVSANAAPPGGEEDPETAVVVDPVAAVESLPAAPPPDPVGAPTPAAEVARPDPERVAGLLEMARARTTPGIIRAAAMHQLEDWGALPDDLVGKVPPRPAPEVAPPPRPGPAPAPVAASPPAPPAEPTTLGMLRRLGPPSGPGDLEAVARALAEEWDDWPSLNCYRKRLELVRSEAVSRRFVVGLYEQCRSAAMPPKSRAKLWNRLFSDELARPRARGRR